MRVSRPVRASATRPTPAHTTHRREHRRAASLSPPEIWRRSGTPQRYPIVPPEPIGYPKPRAQTQRQPPDHRPPTPDSRLQAPEPDPDGPSPPSWDSALRFRAWLPPPKPPASRPPAFPTHPLPSDSQAARLLPPYEPLTSPSSDRLPGHRGALTDSGQEVGQRPMAVTGDHPEGPVFAPRAWYPGNESTRRRPCFLPSHSQCEILRPVVQRISLSCFESIGGRLIDPFGIFSAPDYAGAGCTKGGARSRRVRQLSTLASALAALARTLVPPPGWRSPDGGRQFAMDRKRS